MIMRIDDYDTADRFAAMLEESVRITPDDAEDEIRNLALRIETPRTDFEAGQSISVVVPGPHPFGHDEHIRLYTVANTPAKSSGFGAVVEICVKRCFYIDEFSGQQHRGIASNYLCDRQPGDEIIVAGPYGLPFHLPDDTNADLLMIGQGTGIAPFRAFVRHIYERLGCWKGKVRLFYGARSGLEMVYMNDRRNDFANYYDEETFKAFAAVSPRPHMDDPIDMDRALRENSEEVWEMVLKPDTQVYVAGLEKGLATLEKAFGHMAGSAEKWQRRKAELVAGKRWTELLY